MVALQPSTLIPVEGIEECVRQMLGKLGRLTFRPRERKRVAQIQFPLSSCACRNNPRRNFWRLIGGRRCLLLPSHTLAVCAFSFFPRRTSDKVRVEDGRRENNLRRAGGVVPEDVEVKLDGAAGVGRGGEVGRQRHGQRPVPAVVREHFHQPSGEGEVSGVWEC